MTVYQASASTAHYLAHFIGDQTGIIAAQAYEHELFTPVPIETAVEAEGAWVAGPGKTIFPTTTHEAEFVDEVGPTQWFERFHILPRELVLGNILGLTVRDLELYSAFRHDVHDWESYVNNAGVGTTLLGQPSFPYTVQPQSDGGLTLQVEIDPNGPAFVDTTLDFGFDVGTIYLPISFRRVVLIAMRPERGYQEILQFFTEVMPHKIGTEQRHSLRPYPRQFFEWDFKLESTARAALENILYEWQTRALGIPIWHEATVLTTPASAGGSVITVSTTNYADYRLSGSNLVLVYQDESTYDVLPLLSMTSTTLTLDGSLSNSYSAGAEVMPLRTGFVDQVLYGSRYPRNLSKRRLRLRVENNVVDIADTSAYPSLNSKVFLSEYNLIDGEMSENWEKDLILIDGDIGITRQESAQDRARRGHQKIFFARNAQQIWEARQLLHALRGKQVSFYIPTFHDDLEVVVDLVSGNSSMVVAHCNYTNYVQSRTPRNFIRITFTDATTLTRTIIGAVETSSTQETLTLNTSWPANRPVSEIERVEYIELVRFDSDSITIAHQANGHSAKIYAPLKTVLE